MKEFLGFVAIILAIVGFFPYIFDIFKGKTKPHLFSWILWTTTTILVFFGQMQKGAGAGAWNTGIVGIICIFITFLTIRNGTKDITKLDRILFALSLLAIIPWLKTHDPTLSVVILTGINVAAAALTMRKTINNPGSESLLLYVASTIRHFLSIMALQNINLATYIFPAALLVCNMSMIIIILKPKIKH